MKKYLILFITALIPFLALSSAADLIDFDKKSKQRYFKKHKIISADLDKEFNFWDAKHAYSIFFLNDVVSNFVEDSVGSFFLQIKYEDWVYCWLKDHKELRIYFEVNDQTGVPELLGYSQDKLNMEILKEYHDLPEIELVDCSKLDTAELEEGRYVVGNIDFDFQYIYPFVFKSQIMLYYPSDLKSRDINLYGASYNLNKPISVALIREIVQNGVQLVLKRVDDGGYEIYGFL